MKKANFNTLQNLPVPESWIENALAIPEKEAQTPVVIPFWRKPRFIAAAASLVLVSALSIALFLSTGISHPPVAVKPVATEIVWSTDANGEAVATEVVVRDGTSKQENAKSTEAKPPIVQFFERIFGAPSATESADSGISPTTVPDTTGNGKPSPPDELFPSEEGRTTPTRTKSPTESAHSDPASPTEASSGSPQKHPTEAYHPQETNKTGETTAVTEAPKTDPTEKTNPQPTTAPTEGEKSKPTEKPSPSEPEQHPTTAPTEPPQGTESPSEEWWEYPPTEAPWLPFYPTESWDPSPTQPPKPTEPQPTEDPDAKYYHDTLTHKIPANKIPEGSTLYIKLVDGHGKLLGDPDLYSDQHLVTVDYWNSSYVGISYTPNAYGIIPERGYYRYKIYNQDGVSIEPYYRAGLNP